MYDVQNSGFMTLELPVNEHVVSGENEISVITYPLFDDDDEQTDDYIEGSTLSVGLYVKEDSADANTRKLIRKVEITPSSAYLAGEHEIAHYTNQTKGTSISVTKDASVLEYPVYGVYKKQVLTKWSIDNIDSNLPHWQWQDGDIITNDKDHYNGLVQAYAEIHKSLSDKNLQRIKNIASNRSKELATAYYLGDEEAGFEYSALGKHVNSTSKELYPETYLENTKFEIMANGKLARITTGSHAQPIIYVDMESGQTIFYQFMWYLKNGKWILIR